MLDELRRFENLGTPKYFWELFCQLKKNDNWSEVSISEYFFNRLIDGRGIFDGCIPLLKAVNIIFIHEETKEVLINFKYDSIIYTEQLCNQKLLEAFLFNFSKDEKFYSIFSSEYCHYDLIYKTIVVDYGAFGFRYATIRNLLLDFNFLLPHPDFKNKFIINSKYKKFFDKNITPEIRKRKIGIDELKEQLEGQQINGEEAEKYAVEYEVKRLNGKEGIEWIAPYDTGAGYDILSFHNEQSTENNRFIEVKSFFGVPTFYWSKNEMNVAKQKRENYFLYLYNREDSSIEIIQDPYENILNSGLWSKEVSNYYITKV